jgi:hypothetical protein
VLYNNSEKPNPRHANRLGLQWRCHLPLNHLYVGGAALPRELASRILKLITNPMKTTGNNVGFDKKPFERVGRLEMCAQ